MLWILGRTIVCSAVLPSPGLELMTTPLALANQQLSLIGRTCLMRPGQDSVAASLSLVRTQICSLDKDLWQTGCIHPDCPWPPIAALQPPATGAYNKCKKIIAPNLIFLFVKSWMSWGLTGIFWNSEFYKMGFIQSTVKHHSSIIRVGNFLIEFWSKSLTFCQKSEQISNSLKKWVICSFALFWWATWAIRSQLLIPSEQPEQIAHGWSFVLSDLSNLLTSLRRNERIFCFLRKLFKQL